MATTLNTTSKGVTSKIQEVQKIDVSFGANNDTLVITHADDPLWGRQISVYNDSGVQLDIDGVGIAATTDTTTTVTNTTGGSLSNAVIVCVVPVT